MPYQAHDKYVGQVSSRICEPERLMVVIMNFSRAKTILIVIFILVNVTLFIVLNNLTSENAYTDKSNLVSILEANNITFNEHIIKKYPRTIDAIEIYNVAMDTEKCLNSFLGQGYEKIDEFTYTSGSKQIKIINNNIDYSNSSPNDKKIRKINEFNAGAKIIDYLSNQNLDNNLFYINDVIVNQNGTYTVNLNSKYNEYLLFNSNITAIASKSGITSIKGPILSPYISNNIRYYDILPAQSVIIELINNPEAKSATPVTILSLDLGYFVPQNNSAMSINAIPAYRVILDNKKIFYYDARVGIPNSQRLLSTKTASY